MKKRRESINDSVGGDRLVEEHVSTGGDVCGRPSSPGGTWPANAGEVTVGDRLVAAVVPSSSLLSVNEPEGVPLPVVDLATLYRDASIFYGMGRVDRSGRVSERSVVGRLSWASGDRLQVNVVSGVVVFQRNPHGPLVLTARSYVPIPTSVQARCGVHAGDRVLLAAAHAHGLLAVYPFSVLDKMMAQYCDSLVQEGSA